MSILTLPIFACAGIVMLTGMQKDLLSTTVVAIVGLLKLGMIYQVMSEKVKKLNKWANLRAFAFLNTISA
ncbi:hypothetical protein KVT40_005739 [Elsinoe batatas]|uniref:Uncharacterized protein n=1 Tax=Elsinoe batatas TaxID=2601811 RepID=A0A8K0KZD5_9PEZI|nr:hypothetical protein KVT40_005739 [Elsinoe batatas]